MTESVPSGEGHRARLRKRLIEGTADALLDHELIEYLLMLVVPRRDTKPLAKKLLRDFGGFGPLLAADRDMMAGAGLTDTMIGALRIVQVAALRMLQTQIMNQPVLASWQALIDYLQADMAHLTHERVRVLFLNARNMLIRDEILWEGSIDQAAVHIREVIRHAMDLGAVSLIIVHNHPSGDPSPSRADIELTRNLIDAGRHLSITVHDHVIISRTGHQSLRSLGLI